MGSSPSPPPAPDPVQQQKIASDSAAQTAKIQGDYNLKALQQSQAATMIGQNTPIGSLSYYQSGKDSQGNPMYSLNAQLSPDQQKLYNASIAGKTSSANAGQNMLASSAGMYSDPTNMINNIFTGADSLTANRVNAALGFQQPFMQQDRGYLDNQLRNQGLTPDSPAYQRQMAELDKQQYGNQQNYISSVLPQSMSTAQGAYMLPLQVGQQESQYGAPSGITQMNTPAFTAQAPDYTGAVGTSLNAQNANYSNQVSAYNAQLGAQGNMMNGIFGIGAAGLKMPGMNTLLFG